MVFLGIFVGIAALIALILACPLQAVISYNKELSIKLGVPFYMFDYYADYDTMLQSDSISDKRKKKIYKKLMKMEKKADKQAEKLKAKNQKLKEKGKKTIPTRQSVGVGDLLKKPKTAKRNIRFLLRLAWILLRRFGSKLCIRVKKLDLVIASEDAATTAYLFGTACAGLSGLLAAAEALPDFAYTNSKVNIRADFLSEECRVDAKITVGIRIGHLLKLLFFPPPDQPPLIQSIKEAASKQKKKKKPTYEKGTRHEPKQA